MMINFILQLIPLKIMNRRFISDDGEIKCRAFYLKKLCIDEFFFFRIRRVRGPVQVHGVADAQRPPQNNRPAFRARTLPVRVLNHRSRSEVNPQQLRQPEGGQEEKKEVREQRRAPTDGSRSCSLNGSTLEFVSLLILRNIL